MKHWHGPDRSLAWHRQTARPPRAGALLGTRAGNKPAAEQQGRRGPIALVATMYDNILYHTHEGVEKEPFHTGRAPHPKGAGPGSMGRPLVCSSGPMTF